MLDNLISILIQLVVLYWDNQLLLILSTIGLLNGWNVKHPIIIISYTNTDIGERKRILLGWLLSLLPTGPHIYVDVSISDFNLIRLGKSQSGRIKFP